MKLTIKNDDDTGNKVFTLVISHKELTKLKLNKFDSIRVDTLTKNEMPISSKMAALTLITGLIEKENMYDLRTDSSGA